MAIEDLTWEPTREIEPKFLITNIGVFRLADIPWLPEDLVADLRIAVYEDFADPFDRLAAMSLAAEHIFDALNALKEGEKE